MDRRTFLKSMGLGAVAAVVPKEPETQKVKVQFEYVKADQDIWECDGPNCQNYFCNYNGDPRTLPFGWSILKDETGYEHFLCSMTCAEAWNFS